MIGLRLSCAVGMLALLQLPLPARAAPAGGDFRSAWPEEVTRIWVGPEYWSNRLQDWRVARGRLECVTSGRDRNVHLLTRDLADRRGGFSMSVRLGRIEAGAETTTPGWAGFRVGVKGAFNDYRDSCRRGKGLDAGITTTGELFIGPGLPGAGLTGYINRGMPRGPWRIARVDSEETRGEDSRARNVFDGRPETTWHTQWRERKAPYPHEIVIDLGKSHEVCGICYLPRQNQPVGRIKDYGIYVSADGEEWGEPVARGRFANSAEMQEVRFDETRGRFVRLVAKSDFMGRPACAIAELYVLDTASEREREPDRGEAKRGDALPLDDIVLRLSAEPDGDRYRLALTAHDPETGRKLHMGVTASVTAHALVGNLALVCHGGPAAGGGRRTRGSAAGGNVRFWFRDWRLAGTKVASHNERVFGPVMWAQHTLSPGRAASPGGPGAARRGVLKMTAQMAPVGETESQTVRLEAWSDEGGHWGAVADAGIDPLSRTATFRVENWDAARDTPCRVAYAFTEADGTRRDRYWKGTVRRDPVDKHVIVVAGFTGNADYAFPNNDLVEHVRAHDPDVLFFSGDNIYENVGGYGIERAPLERACLDYLRKWYFFGWAYAELLRDRPCVSIPDDHDVYHGNLWGAGGRKARTQNSGGYTMPAEWVKMVERTQTSSLPDPYDPTPVEQGIGVYYTAMTYGRVSFAIIEDRKFKSGPEGLVPKTKGRSDHVSDPDFDPKTADVPGATLLGERQLAFLRDWAADWRGADMKCALSQTTFCNVATLHGGGLNRLIADYDSNGWPQTGRNRALRELRRGFAFHISGDQHLATIVHYGIDGWNDAGWSLCVPSVTNFYPRAWVPLKPAHNWTRGMIEHTGEFLDPFGNYITVWAHTNPRKMGKEPAWLHDKMPGYGIVRFDKRTRKITIECWPRFADPRDPATGGQYEGWPKVVDQLDNYGREAVAYLPTIEVTGATDPVVQVVDEADGEVVYTLRIMGTSFRPKVFTKGPHTVRVGEPDTDAMKVLRGVRPLAPGESRTVRVEF